MISLINLLNSHLITYAAGDSRAGNSRFTPKANLQPASDNLVDTSSYYNHPSEVGANTDAFMPLIIRSQPQRDLLGIYVLAFDNRPESTLNLDHHYAQVMQTLLTATEKQPDRAAVVLVDRPGPNNTFIYQIVEGTADLIIGLPDEEGTLQDWDTLGALEYNVANGASLGGFLIWARNTYPAPKTIFSYMGHGAPLVPETFPYPLTGEDALQSEAKMGSGLFTLPIYTETDPDFTDHYNPLAVDPTTADVISPYDLAQALQASLDAGQPPLDVLDLIHCFAASIEEFYELSPYAQVITGSPNYAYSAPEMPGRALAAITPTDDAAQIATDILTTYHEVIGAYDIISVEHPRIMVAVETADIPPIKEAWDEVAVAWLDEFALRPAQSIDNLHRVYLNSPKYDTDYCQAQWELEPPDALSDMHGFAKEMTLKFSSVPNIVTWADETAARIEDAIITTIYASGTPWFADVVPAPYWDFQPYYGLALFTDMETTPLTIKGSVENVVTWQLYYYTDTVSLDNPHPYQFILPDQTTETWAAVLTTYWQWRANEQGVSGFDSALCLPEFPPIQHTGEVGIQKLIAPRQVHVTSDSAFTPTVIISSTQIDGSIPLVNFQIEHKGSLVYTDTVSLGTAVPTGQIITGTYLVQASKSWLPHIDTPSEARFVMTVTVDVDNRVVEVNENDNQTVFIDDVLWPTCMQASSFQATVANDWQWLQGTAVPLHITSSHALTQLEISVYNHAESLHPYYHVPTFVSTEVITDLAALPDLLYDLPALNPGVVMLHIWAETALCGPISHPAIVRFNYVPTDATFTVVMRTHYFLYEANACDEMQMDVAVANNKTVSLVGWDPSAFTPQPTQFPLFNEPDQLQFMAPLQGEYVLAVRGDPAVSYTLTVTRNGVLWQ